MNKSESIKELATALSKAQGELENASKTSANPFFKSKYADLAEVINTAKPVLAANGLSIIQMPGGDAALGIVSVETMLCHSSGEWISNLAIAPLNEKISNGKPVPPDAQSVGSAISYLRRYSYTAFLGMAQEDDDGNAASQPGAQKKPAPEPRKAPTAKAKEPFDIEGAVLDMTSQPDLESLQKSFGVAWKLAQTEQDKILLKDAYEELKRSIEE
jgi:hypothetical protein